MNIVKNTCVLLILSAAISGCATMPVFMDRSSVAEDIAGKAGFKKVYVKTADFTLMTYQRLKGPSKTIRLYIEGDGRAWETRTRLSDDPTPSNPVALKLAAADPSDNVIYVARPGQFTPEGAGQCDPAYWSTRRFSAEVVEALNGVIKNLKTETGASDIELVGFSGGGALAVLVAAKRNDIISIRTIAGNLDHRALCEYHHVSPLDGSLNPIDYAPDIKHIPQRHFVGSKDKVVPAFIARSFVEREGDKNYDRVTIVEDATHTKGWRERWKKLLSLSPSTPFNGHIDKM
ncbi:MAG: alpha/beta hydrolase [Candidatus Omnitrophica bacterium]|nr:alpha/beta hydrolase [Candidatus Omnitrophota bacterium]